MIDRLRRALSFALTGPILAALVPAQDVQPPDAPFLWRVDGAPGTAPSYLFGTIHLPDPRVTTLHPAVEAALSASDAVYTELRMDADTMIEASRLMILEDRKKLDDVLPAALYERLDKFFADRNLPLGLLSRIKIWAIAAQVPLVDHLAEIAQGEALDKMLYRRAEEAGKTVGGLEEVEEQIAVFDSLSQREQIQMLVDALDQYDEMQAKGEEPIEKIIELYRRGDAEALMVLMHESSSADDALQQKIENALLWTRNQRMAERIVEHRRVTPEQTMFFAVGAAHMPDERGVVELLRRAGLTVTRLPESAADVEARIRELERELERLRSRLVELRKAG